VAALMTMQASVCVFCVWYRITELSLSSMTRAVATLPAEPALLVFVLTSHSSGLCDAHFVHLQRPFVSASRLL